MFSISYYDQLQQITINSYFQISEHKFHDCYCQKVLVSILINVQYTAIIKEFSKIVLIKSMTQPLLSNQGSQIKIDSYRYINLTIFVFGQLVNFAGQAFTSIGPHTCEVYNVSSFQVTLNALFPPLMNVVLLYPSTYIVEKYGIRLGISLSAYFMIVGLAIRLLVNVNFYFFLLGTFITTLGYTFMLISPNKFATNWFPQKHISIVSTVCLFSLYISGAIGSFSSSLFLDESSDKQDYFTYFLWLSVVIATVQVLMILFFRGKPKNPQNFASIAKRTDPKFAILDLLKNKSYLFLFLSITFIYALVSVVLVTFSWQLSTYNFSSSVAGYFIIVTNLTGFVGCAIFSVILEKTRQYKKILVVCAFSGVVGYCVTLTSFQLESLWLLYTSGVLLGLFFYAFLTMTGDFAAQIAFPIGQSAATGLLTAGGQLLSIPCSLVLNIFFQDENRWKTRIGNGIQTLLFLIGAVFMVFVKQQLNRTKYQNSRQKNNEQKDEIIQQITQQNDEKQVD